MLLINYLILHSLIFHCWKILKISFKAITSGLVVKCSPDHAWLLSGDHRAKGAKFPVGNGVNLATAQNCDACVDAGPDALCTEAIKLISKYAQRGLFVNILYCELVIKLNSKYAQRGLFVNILHCELVIKLNSKYAQRGPFCKYFVL